MGISQDNTDLGGGSTLAGKLDDVLLDLSGAALSRQYAFLSIISSANRAESTDLVLSHEGGARE
jgi:hypothetical protein